MNTTLIRPGLLVSLKTTVVGGVSYSKREIEAERADGAALVATWQTTRYIQDADEHAAAIVARGKARTAISRVCCSTSFGLLCPESSEPRLVEALEEARRIADEHNARATCTRLEVYAITGRVADSDERAAQAIGSEVRDLIAAMEAGVRAADPEAIREAASKARAIAGMLSDDTQKKVSAAISEVRSIARDIVRRVEKSGERAADVVDGLKLEALKAARFAVLDIDAMDPTDDLAPASAPIAPRSLDLMPDDMPPPPPVAAMSRQIELGV